MALYIDVIDAVSERLVLFLGVGKQFVGEPLFRIDADRAQRYILHDEHEQTVYHIGRGGDVIQLFRGVFRIVLVEQRRREKHSRKNAEEYPVGYTVADGVSADGADIVSEHAKQRIVHARANCGVA